MRRPMATQRTGMTWICRCSVLPLASGTPRARARINGVAQTDRWVRWCSINCGPLPHHMILSMALAIAAS